MATDVVQQSEFVPTKRGILSNVSKTFDVLGWITPVIFPMKLLLKELWKKKKGWDEAIEDRLEEIHQIWRKELPLLASILLPRCYFLSEKTVEVTLQGFSDASSEPLIKPDPPLAEQRAGWHPKTLEPFLRWNC